MQPQGPQPPYQGYPPAGQPGQNLPPPAGGGYVPGPTSAPPVNYPGGGPGYPAPGPGNPAVPPQPVQTNYEFIMASGSAPKQKFGGAAGGGSTMQQRLLIVGGGAAVLVTVFIILAAILTSGGGSSTENLIRVGAQQTEIVRVAAIGTEKARGPQAQALASTAALTISSDLFVTTELIKKSGQKLDTKLLQTAKDDDIDAALETADQSSRFDEEFISIMATLLNGYRAELKTAYEAVPDQPSKDAMTAGFEHAGLLLGPAQANQTTPNPSVQ